jgi:hypothetical protein
VGRIDVILPEDLEEEFRTAVAKELGMRRGNLTLAMQEAIRLWIETRHEKRSELAKKAWESRKKAKQEEGVKIEGGEKGV